MLRLGDGDIVGEISAEIEVLSGTVLEAEVRCWSQRNRVSLVQTHKFGPVNSISKQPSTA